MDSSFGKSFGRELGKNTAKVISNAVFGDSWSTPYRRVNRDVQKRHEDRMRLKREAAERKERKLRIAERQQADEAYRARRAIMVITYLTERISLSYSVKILLLCLAVHLISLLMLYGIL